ncbi:hypothetical protein Q4512_00110 [Oceanihabitans sp. 2_MG-2023]|uniref:hypothetical protein n=1 Tax=Oceanihabitans sp. 2_MG-2023 TaxID=3062661 RepID=UPI0026E153DC|nr:hypothetical protein [Oceanihabitans sp. 2_MG-2023]MDO6595293.1 hypothetical protein [Oceanihabitans sp. 2_MG-2023]
MPLGESMLLTLKNNKNLKRLKKKITRSFFGEKIKTTSLYSFPEATPEVLERIRLQMAIQNKEETIAYLISLVITLLVLVFVII